MNSFYPSRRFAGIGFFLIAFCTAISSAFAEDAADAGVTEQSVSALDLYNQGGSFMHILLVCSIGTIAVAVYCFVQINRKKMAPPEMVEQVNRAMAAKDVGTAYSSCQGNSSSYAKVMSGALLKVNFERDLANKASMMDAAAEGLDEEEHRQMVWVNYLNIFATLAPMVGLLGTVWGMIEAFDKLATTSGDAKQLAGGIKIAMVTTAGGLIVGIPAMFFYFFFRDKLQGVMTTVQKHASFAIDILSGEIRLEGVVQQGAAAEAAPEASEDSVES
ncbi:MotA/TolQ/ExbB proton channel family protein [Verrucomicrobiales bacterium]|nr:MotA/TolQ/ExbB proton channel family protein [Verrucomicrobiales bacterium]